MAVAERLSSQEVISTTRVQILNEAVSILHYTNTFGKSKNPTILSPVMGK